MNTLPDREAILARLTTGRLGRGPIETHASLDSTNLRARRLAEAGAAHGTLVVAQAQTAGRGRLKRVWHSPPGQNLYFSLVLRPSAGQAAGGMLVTLAAGLGLAESVAGLTGLACGLKWPNDLLIDGRKTAGILAEAGAARGRLGFVVLGVGLNVNMDAPPPELAGLATSLRLATGRRFDLNHALAAFLNAFEPLWEELEQTNGAALVERYTARCLTLGREVAFEGAQGPVRGLAVGLDEYGGLLVQPAGGGPVRSVTAGDVNLLKRDR